MRHDDSGDAQMALVISVISIFISVMALVVSINGGVK